MPRPPSVSATRTSTGVGRREVDLADLRHLFDLVQYVHRESHNPVQYFARLFPLSRADLRSYRGMGIDYWLTLWTVFSAFVAGIIGFVNLWVLELGPSIFGHCIKWLGLDKGGYQDATLDPHSHMMALAIVAGVVAIAAAKGASDAGADRRRS